MLIRRIDDFIYWFTDDNGFIIISYVGTTATHHPSVSRLNVKIKLHRKMCIVQDAPQIEVEYQGNTYPGVTYYNNVSEQELIEALS